jgi:hypothetical protein
MDIFPKGLDDRNFQRFLTLECQQLFPMLIVINLLLDRFLPFSIEDTASNWFIKRGCRKEQLFDHLHDFCI